MCKQGLRVHLYKAKNECEKRNISLSLLDVNSKLDF